MPYFKCRKCHHEFESVNARNCDWCEADNPEQLEEATPLEMLISELVKPQEKNEDLTSLA